MQKFSLFLLFWFQVGHCINGGQQIYDSRFNGVIKYNLGYNAADGSYLDRRGECTGTVVALNKILTARHCAEAVYNESATEKFIVIQASLLNTEAKKFKLKKIDLHPNYDHLRILGAADLAILTTEENLNLPAYELIKNFADLSTREIILAGYGCDLMNTEDPLNHKKILKVGRRQIKSADDESIILEKEQGPEATGTCKGDSGGPAFILLDNRLILAGVISANKLEDGQSQPFLESVLTRIDQDFDHAHNSWLKIYIHN